MKKIAIAILAITLFTACEFKVNSKNNDENQPDPMAEKQDAMKTETADLPFPLQTGFSDAYLKATFWKCNYSSAGPSHTYWVILPNTLRPTTLEPEVLKPVALTNIGIYNTIDKTLPYIEVRFAFENVADSITPSAWLLHKIKITGESVLQENNFQYEDGQKNLDVLTSKTLPDGEKVISRFVGQKKGNDYYLIKVSCNEKDYLTQANTIFHVVSHWGAKS